MTSSNSFKAERPEKQHRALRRRLNNVTGAVDLASIMVGALVIGVVGGVVAATVFAVVPWSQDNAAKQSLSAVHAAESVVRVQEGKFVTSEGLIAAGVFQGSSKIAVGTDEAGTCYVGLSRSDTSRVFFGTDEGPDVHELTPEGPEPGCLTDDEIAELLDAIGVVEEIVDPLALCDIDPKASATVVSTKIQLVNALAAGGDIRLGADITTTDIKVGASKSAIVDLGGFALNITPASYSGSATFQVPAGADLTVTDSGMTGTLTARAGGNNAAIGGGYGYAAGDITIDCGTVTAKAGTHSAAIGGGNKGTFESVTINGGIVDALSYVTYSTSAAAIGAGYDVATVSGAVALNGGVVTAKAGTVAADSFGNSQRGAVASLTLKKGTINGVRYPNPGPMLTEAASESSVKRAYDILQENPKVPSLTLQMTADLSLPDHVIPAGKLVTMDLNGHAVSAIGYGGFTNPGVGVPADSTFIVNDSGAGGSLTATGSRGAAGIGGGSNGAGHIVINAGTVTAKGDSGGGAGIGGAYRNTFQSVTINGGTVNAQSYRYSIYGNSQDRSAAAIGAALEVAAPAGTITMNGGTVTALAGAVKADSFGNSSQGSVASVGLSKGTINGVTYPNPGPMLIDVAAESTVKRAYDLMEENPQVPSLTFRMTSDVSLTDHILPAGRQVTIDLNGKAVAATGSGSFDYAGIGVPVGSTFIVKDSGASGTLTATGSNRSAGIGGSSYDAGHIVINSGNVIAIGGSSGGGAGIGGGYTKSFQSVTINGGNVNARSPYYQIYGNSQDRSAAAIGAALEVASPAGTIALNGGIVTAIAGAANADSFGNSPSGAVASAVLSKGTINGVTYPNPGAMLVDAASESAVKRAYDVLMENPEVPSLTVRMTADVTLPIHNLPAGKQVTMDLNGRMVTAPGHPGYTGAGIGVPVNSTFIVKDTGSGGTLTATGTSGGAGIGGASSAAGHVIINSGTVIAKGDSYGGAGIGGSRGQTYQSITISGGIVNAQSYRYNYYGNTLDRGAAAIGSGLEVAAVSGPIAINGGAVTATASSTKAENIGRGTGKDTQFSPVQSVTFNGGTVN